MKYLTAVLICISMIHDHGPWSWLNSQSCDSDDLYTYLEKCVILFPLWVIALLLSRKSSFYM